MSNETKRANGVPASNVATTVWEYWVDAVQRQILYLDVMRRRGNQFLEHQSEGNPPVLQFEHEMLIDGRTLERPCNYALLRIVPDDETAADVTLRPFVVIDPRAGHGPGIGGSKHDSQVGVALRAGHPVYFVTFFPEPVPGQTLSDVAAAEAHFIEEVTRRHPEAPAKPCVIGNCQAGWAVAALASIVPDLVGPILLNGAPMSYWAGVDGKNPMRYSGGLLGGKWLASLAGELGNGRFDGAHLVANFENLNPANTLWTKQYNLYSRVDTESERYLGFEKWWGGFFLMNAEEMDAIVSELFIGNRLASGSLTTKDGSRLDLRNIRSPIVVFASWGDNITPPQQALNWIIDLYEDEEQITRNGQTIVYVLHEDIGHLGIFVSGKVAKKEHAEIVQTLDLIEALPPGLYEMVIEPKIPGIKHEDLVPGDFIVQLEGRTIADLQALDDKQRDEEYFTAVERISQMNDWLYRTFASPWVRATSNEWTAAWMRWMHPLRFERRMFSDQNPLMQGVAGLAEGVAANRQAASTDNFLVGLERDTSSFIVDALDAYRDTRDDFGRNLFKLVYGPFGLGALFPPEDRGPRHDPVHIEEIEAYAHSLLERIEEGGFAEGVMRMIAANMTDERRVDRRSALLARKILGEHPRLAQISDLTPTERRRMFKDQALMLYLDSESAIAALPKLLPTQAERDDAVAIAIDVLMAEPGDEQLKGPLATKIASVLGLGAPTEPAAKPAPRTRSRRTTGKVA